jgi:hypothetical protein
MGPIKLKYFDGIRCWQLSPRSSRKYFFREKFWQKDLVFTKFSKNMSNTRAQLKNLLFLQEFELLQKKNCRENRNKKQTFEKLRIFAKIEKGIFVSALVTILILKKIQAIRRDKNPRSTSHLRKFFIRR